METHVPQPVAVFQAKWPKPPDLLKSPGHLCLTYSRVQPVAKLSAPPGPAHLLSGFRSVLGARLCPQMVSTGVHPRQWARPQHGLFAGSLCARGHGSHTGPFTACLVLPLLCTSLSGTCLSWSQHAAVTFFGIFVTTTSTFRQRNLTLAPCQGSVPTDLFSGCGGTFPLQSTSRGLLLPGRCCGAWSSRPWRAICSHGWGRPRGPSPSGLPGLQLQPCPNDSPEGGVRTRRVAVLPRDRPGHRLSSLLVSGCDGASPRAGLRRG